MEVIVKEVFKTSLGLIAILSFPKAIVPKVNMILKRGMVIYLIKGVQFENLKQNESLDNRHYNCLLSNNASDISSGDILILDNEE